MNPCPDPPRAGPTAAAAHPVSTHGHVMRLARENLLQYRTESGRVETARSPADWQRRLAEIRVGMQEVMGKLPGSEKRVPLALNVERETDCGSYVRREITYDAEPGGRVPAYLLIPKVVLHEKVHRPGVLCLMGTNNIDGVRGVVGLAAPPVKPGRNYGEELAWRGHVVIAPPYPLLADYQPDVKALGYQGGTMKAIWDNIRALDVLESIPGVRPTGFGCIGLSLGGHNSIYTAVFDDRIKAVVSCCGFDSFLDYKDDSMWTPEKGWAQTRYMPRILNYARADIPFDFHELVGALAPRAFLAIAPLRDANFKWRSVDRVIAAARSIYGLYGVPEQLAVLHPDVEHEFPLEMRAQAYRWLERFIGEGETR